MTEIHHVSSAEILAPENEGLLRAYADECSLPQIGPINPQPAMYEAMERAGIFHCFGAFDDGQMVGFATVLTTVLPHYGKKVATVESVFALKGGAELLTAVNAFAKDSACAVVFYSTPVGGRFERLLSANRDCSRTNAIFCRSVA